jgi:hypothetical protein
MYRTQKEVIVTEWSPQSKQARLRNRMMLASRGKLPNAGGDTKANMITYLRDEFGIVLNKQALRTEVDAMLCQCFQLGDALDQKSKYIQHFHQYLHITYNTTPRPPHQRPPPLYYHHH